MHKADLRKQLLASRLAIPEAEWQARSQGLVDQILRWLKGRSFDSYILYRSFRREPTLEALAAILPAASTYYPRVRGPELDFFTAEAGFVTNRFGLEEPNAHPRHQLTTLTSRTLLIIPAVAFDRQRYRLGYGGGFFDRFLAAHPVSTLGVCFDAFLLDELPKESHDQPVQAVMSESRVIQ